MDLQTSKVIGIVGGMGPQAGNVLFEQIMLNTPAKNDQEHLSVILASLPSAVIDRTAYLRGQTQENPAHAIGAIIEKLELAGANLIGMACNTSHAPAILDVIQSKLLARNSKVTLLNMPEETCKFIQENHPYAKRIGLMATNGVFLSGLYHQILQNLGYEVVELDFSFQDQVIHRIIYDPDWGLKANPEGVQKQAQVLIEQTLEYFRQRNTDALILGCTEFSMAFRQQPIPDLPLIDSTQCLAKALVKAALPEYRETNAPVLHPQLEVV